MALRRRDQVLRLLAAPLLLVETGLVLNQREKAMEGTTLRIQNGSRAHAESLHVLLADYRTNVVQQNGSWQIEVELGDLAALLIGLFDTLGAWLEAEQVDSLFLHFDERQFTLLRPSKERSATRTASCLSGLHSLRRRSVRGSRSNRRRVSSPARSTSASIKPSTCCARPHATGEPSCTISLEESPPLRHKPKRS